MDTTEYATFRYDTVEVENGLYIVMCSKILHYLFSNSSVRLVVRTSRRQCANSRSACAKLSHSFYVLVCPSPTGNEGIIKSYNYPYSYPTNINCFWKLVAPRNYRVRLYMLPATHSSFWPHRQYRCSSNCNLLAVYDGLAITDTKLAEKKYNEYFNVVSSSNRLSLLQKTQRKGSNYDGFRVKYIFIRETEGNNYSFWD